MSSPTMRRPLIDCYLSLAVLTWNYMTQWWVIGPQPGALMPDWDWLLLSQPYIKALVDVGALLLLGLRGSQAGYRAYQRWREEREGKGMVLKRSWRWKGRD